MLNYFQGHKVGEGGQFLAFVLFWEHRAQVKLNIVRKDNYRGNKSACFKPDCPQKYPVEMKSPFWLFSNWAFVFLF